MLSGHTIILFYKYISIADPEKLRQEQMDLCKKLGLKGRMIVAKEGINGTFEGTDENIKVYVEDLLSHPGFADIHIKKSVGTGNAFPKLSIKVRPEIVATHL